jgi:large subunit ribosomal protein L10e
MRLSFGKPISRAARVKGGQKVMTLYVHEKGILRAREAIRRAAMKIPMGTLTEVRKV